MPDWGPKNGTSDSFLLGVDSGVCPSKATMGCHAHSQYSHFMSSKEYTLRRGPHLSCAASSRAKVSTVLHAAKDRFLRSQIIEPDEVPFPAHGERNKRAEEHGDGEHSESIPHREKRRQGIQC